MNPQTHLLQEYMSKEPLTPDMKKIAYHFEAVILFDNGEKLVVKTNKTKLDYNEKKWIFLQLCKKLTEEETKLNKAEKMVEKAVNKKKEMDKKNEEEVNEDDRTVMKANLINTEKGLQKLKIKIKELQDEREKKIQELHNLKTVIKKDEEKLMEFKNFCMSNPVLVQVYKYKKKEWSERKVTAKAQ